jgi:hypothetical protein
MKKIVSITQIQQEWQENQRLRLGGWLILSILLVYSLLFLSDKMKSVEAESLDLYSRLEKLQSLTSQSEWPARAQAARSVRVQLESQLFTAESRGLAQANIQTWLDGRIKNLKLAKTRVQVEQARSVSSHQGLLQVTATVDGRFERGKVVELIKSIEVADHLMVIEQFDIIRRKKEHFTLAFRAYFQESPQ